MEKDYTKYSFRITALVIVLMLGISFIPAFSVGGVKFKRTNIISDLYTFDDEEGGDDKERSINASERAFIEEMERMEAEMAAAAAAAEAEPAEVEPQAEEIASDTWELGLDGEYDLPAEKTESKGGPLLPDSELAALAAQQFEGVTAIEDFGDSSRPSVADFVAMLGTASRERVVRIGFLGDSYIEGDILTADVRSQLQETYGGGGVGFVPFSTPLAQNRPTIKHTSGGWNNYNLIKKKSTPENARERFFVSGIVSTPAGKAWSRYENTTFRSGLSSVSAARLLFTNTGSAEIKMTVNDTIVRTFTPVADEQAQMIEVTGAGIQKVRVDVSDADGFYGYGVYLEQRRGVGVDNFSIRSNSGLALFGTNSAINGRIDRIAGYDMIVLQYGLNAMDVEATRYTSYGQQLRKVINYMKSCFPNSVIVVMGVGDRSTLRDGSFVTVPGVHGMIAEQRAAAEECGVAFWNTFKAMGGAGSMNRFVEKGWAAKDYTHLSFGGGRKIATEFVKALEYAKFTASLTQEPEEDEDTIFMAGSVLPAAITTYPDDTDDYGESELVVEEPATAPVEDGAQDTPAENTEPDTIPAPTPQAIPAETTVTDPDPTEEE